MFDEYINLPTPKIPPFAELPTDRGELRKFMFDLYLSHGSIARVAYRLWEADGRPDGESINHLGMSCKDWHWWHAQMMLEVTLDVDFDTVWLGLQDWLYEQQHLGLT